MIGQLRIMVNLERFNFNLTQPKKKNLLPLSLKSGIHGPKPIGPVRYKNFLKISDRTGPIGPRTWRSMNPWLKLIDLRKPMGSLLLPLKIQLIQFWGVKNDRDYESLIAPIELALLKTKPKWHKG